MLWWYIFLHCYFANFDIQQLSILYKCYISTQSYVFQVHVESDKRREMIRRTSKEREAQELEKMVDDYLCKISGLERNKKDIKDDMEKILKGGFGEMVPFWNVCSNTDDVLYTFSVPC